MKNSIDHAKYINKEYKEYLKSTFYMNDIDYQMAFQSAVDNEALYKGPILNIDLPYKSGKNILQLVEEGIIDKDFLTLKNISFERPLYAHQENAIRQVADKQSLVITTGTGSGKTESFLYPILNEIIKLKNQKSNSKGIKALFLYPMNALVNDQMRRIRDILGGTDITYGMYTGDTQYTIDEKLREELNDNELASREEILSNPPDILFVNYSMLEYMMIRPVEQELFSEKALHNWNFMVLDEAHSYNSALGIELSYLLKRVQGWANKSPQFLLTSATLGKEGEANNEILNFANNLTNVSYVDKNIVFAKRDIFNITASMHQDPDIYVKKRNHIRENEIDDLYREELYNLISNDKNIVEFKKIVDQKHEFDLVLSHMVQFGFNENNLSAFIDCITEAKKHGKELFSIRYHMFIKSLDGAFITLGANKNLSIRKKYKINGNKTFEAGLCKQCHEIYIIGEIKQSAENLSTLYFKGDIDIYEDYDDDVSISTPKFFLINKPQDNNDVIEYKLCTECGFIHEANLNMKYKPKCSHSEHSFVSVYNVLSNHHATNITECGSCHVSKKQGIINDFTMGKDNSTAILSQLYFDTISYNDAVHEVEEFNPLNSLMGIVEEKKETDVSQILTFSDSRQQASFFARFSEAMHKRFVRKKLLFEKVNENISKLDVLSELINNDVKVKELYDSDVTDYDKEGYYTTLFELLKVDGNLSGEGLGLYCFKLDLDDVINRFASIDDNALTSSLKFNITKEQFFISFNIIANIFRTTPAIDYSAAGISFDKGIEEFIYRGYENYVCLNSNKGDKKKNVRSLLPINKDNNLTLFFKKAFSIDDNTCHQFITNIFNIMVQLNVLKVEGSSSANYRIPYTNFTIHKNDEVEWYYCDKCKKVSFLNINNTCTDGKCNGKLNVCNINSYFENNYYRHKYINQRVNRFVAKEHTGQINKKDANKYQEDFKNKKINILSCSTTFEMGIDLGGLNYVFMRNVPPTPSNYIQRAGRAGRRQGTTPFVLTYCANTSHDYHYFENPLEIISGFIKPPVFKNDNEKIMIRHLMSTVLAFYFRRNNINVNFIGDFIFEKYADFKQYVLSRPEDLNLFIEKYILTDSLYSKYSGFKWADYILSNNSIFEEFHLKFSNTIELYKEGMKNDPERAYLYSNQIKKIKNTNFIEAFSRDAVIPKYGFPTDVVYLYQNENGRVNYDSNLSRDLRIAIAEYAPDCEVMNNKIKYKSKYINILKSNPLPELFVKTCPDCEVVYKNIVDRFVDECEICKCELLDVKSKTLIIPTNGFIADFQKSNSNNIKPKRSAAGEFQYIGGASSNEEIVLSENVFITSSKDDELLVKNYNSFYMCDVCGYSEKNNEIGNFDKKKILHKRFTGGDCTNELLRKIDLGYVLKTDVIKITIDKNSNFNRSSAYSTLYALLNGIEIEYGVEKNAFSGIVQTANSTVSYIIFDTIPGGAGLVNKLMSKEALINVFKAGLKSVSNDCCDIDVSCDKCLRSYYNQSKHQYLRRNTAIEFINYILESIKNY